MLAPTASSRHGAATSFPRHSGNRVFIFANRLNLSKEHARQLGMDDADAEENLK